MSRRHADPVQVRRRDGVPEQFLWRARLYLVQAVLSDWVESVAWWRTPAALATIGLGETPAGPATVPATVPTPVPAPGPGLLGLTGIPTLDRRVWRVEAGTGSRAPTGVFDLTHLEADDRWLLTRVHD